MSQSHARAAFSQLSTPLTRAAEECERKLPDRDPGSAGEAVAASAARPHLAGTPQGFPGKFTAEQSVSPAADPPS